MQSVMKNNKKTLSSHSSLFKTILFSKVNQNHFLMKLEAKASSTIQCEIQQIDIWIDSSRTGLDRIGYSTYNLNKNFNSTYWITFVHSEEKTRGERKEENYPSKYANRMWINIIITIIKFVRAFIFCIQSVLSNK